MNLRLDRLLLEYPFPWSGSPVCGSAVQAARLLFGEHGEGNRGTSAQFTVLLVLAVKAFTSLRAFIQASHTVFLGKRALYLGTLL